MGKTEIRKQSLFEWLIEKNKISVGEISERFLISLPTARKTCALLVEEGKAIRTHGGIQRLPTSQLGYSFDMFTNENIEEKRRIGKHAASLIENNSVIFLEAGTTLLQCAIAFAERIKHKQLQNIIVFTNSLMNLEVLHPVCSVNLIGGMYRGDQRDLIGYMSELALKDLHFDYCFVGADAISLSSGVMAMDIDTVRFNRELAGRSEKVVILAHSEKLRRQSLLSFVAIDDVSCIVTDSGLDDDLFQRYQEKDVNLIRV